MSKLVEKVNWNMPNQKPCQMYMYGEASFEANQQMQELLEKLYHYENQPDIRDKIKEYIIELDAEINRLAVQLEEHLDDEADIVTGIESRINTLIDVKLKMTYVVE